MLGATLSFVFYRLRVLGAAELLTFLIGVITLILLATALLGWSPLYALFRFSSKRPDDTLPLKRV